MTKRSAVTMTKRWAILFSSILWTACGASPEATQLAKSAVSDATCPTGRNACCSKIFPPGDSRGQQCVSAAAHGEGPCAAAENCGGQCPVIGGLHATGATLPPGSEFLLSPGIIDSPAPGAISYDWHLVGGSVGILEPVPTPDAIFVCTSIGVQTVELTITGGNPKGDCTSSSTLTIDCTSLCGNGIFDPGESCDDGPETPALCRNCQGTNCGACFATWSGAGRVGICGGLSVDDTRACNALITCGTQDLARCATTDFRLGALACYCSDPTCSAGANGPCATQFQALAHSDDPAVVRAQIADSSTLVGRIAGALQRFSTYCGSACFVFNN